MTFEEVCRKYPKYTTLVGNYYNDENFEAHCYKDVENIDKWDYPPLEPILNSIPFIYYNTTTDKFECWLFSYDTVSGYINETDNPNNFYPLIYSESFGLEKIDFNSSEYIIFTPNEEEAAKLGFENPTDYAAREAQVTFHFDKEEYIKGNIFTSYDAVKNFCRKMENNS